MGAVQPPTVSGARRPVTFWWFLAPLLSFGLFACVPPFIAAVWLRSKLLTVTGVGYLLMFGAFAALPSRSDGSMTGWRDPVGMLLFVTAWFGGTAHALVLQTKVRNACRRRSVAADPWAPPAWPGSSPYQEMPQQSPPQQPALLAARERLRRRGESRELLASDPVLASELKIGRPDLCREYDDGGLVDINRVPAGTLISELGLEPRLAERIVTERSRLGGFSYPDELVVYCEGITGEQVADLRDRLLFRPL